jgi:hypothetical protein
MPRINIYTLGNSYISDDLWTRRAKRDLEGPDLFVECERSE